MFGKFELYSPCYTLLITMHSLSVQLSKTYFLCDILGGARKEMHHVCWALLEEAASRNVVKAPFSHTDLNGEEESIICSLNLYFK